MSRTHLSEPITAQTPISKHGRRHCRGGGGAREAESCTDRGTDREAGLGCERAEGERGREPGGGREGGRERGEGEERGGGGHGWEGGGAADWSCLCRYLIRADEL
jgi:hypothetical protein